MRQKDSQRDLETKKTESERLRNKETERLRNKETERLRNKETERLRDSQRDLETVRETWRLS